MKASDVFLDYGGGDGHLIRTAISQGLGGKFAIYDPHLLRDARETLAGFSEVAFCEQASALPDRSFSKIACLEVLEHVPVEKVRDVIADIYRLLCPGGAVVLSVPIEIGPVSLAKNLARLISGTAFPNTTVSNVLLSLLGITASIARCDSHVGFDYRGIVPCLIQAGFVLKSRGFSPFNFGGALVNSQVHYRAERPA